jgi:glycosyltransferase involved in cell wall biosynthesis
MKLVVVSSLEHYRAGGGVVGAWPAAVREVDALASLFGRVVHVACLHAGEAPAQAASYRAPNVELALLPPAGGPGLIGKLGAAGALPGRLAAIQRAWRDADAALVRCPSNVAVAALALMSVGHGPRRRWVKYTGQWRQGPDEKMAYRLQRCWLRSGATGAAVTVGGVIGDTEAAPGGGAIGLSNPSLIDAEVRAAEYSTRGKALTRPWRLVAVSRLVESKGLDVAIGALARMTQRGCAVELDIAGDGPARAALEAQAESCGVRRWVRFHGWVPEGALAELYAGAHVLLAPSRTEGWSRAWSDAAAHRCVPVAADAGAARGLERAGAGMVIPSRNPAVWAACLESLLSDGAAWRALAEGGPALARSFTYERFLEEVRTLFGLNAASREREVFEGV